MTGRINLTPEAERQLNEIDDWIARTTNADTARRFVTAVLEWPESWAIWSGWDASPRFIHRRAADGCTGYRTARQAGAAHRVKEHLLSESPHGTDDPREIVDDLETRTEHEATTPGEDTTRKKDSPDLAKKGRGDQSDIAPSVPGSPEPPD